MNSDAEAKTNSMPRKTLNQLAAPEPINLHCIRSTEIKSSQIIYFG
jgi:hypothetical protein